MARRPFYDRNRVGHRAARDLREYQHRTGRRLVPPIDAELIGEVVYDLSWDWEEIEEPRGSRVLAALYVSDKRAVLNERHLEHFNDHPGLEQFTRGHEVGHAALHVEKGYLGVPFPPLLRNGDLVFHRDRSTLSSNDLDLVERQANWYAAALLMPEDLFTRAWRDLRPTSWSDVRQLAGQFGVTPSAANVRLRVLKLPHWDNGRWVEDTNTPQGQLTLGLG